MVGDWKVEAKFILSKKKLVEQVKVLENLGLKVSYSYKTNREVGRVLQDISECSECDFSIHAQKEIEDIKNRERIWFFTQAESLDELKGLIDLGIRNFVIDNEVDLGRILEVIVCESVKINLSLRMKFKEHRIEVENILFMGWLARKLIRWLEVLEKMRWLESLVFIFIEKVKIQVSGKLNRK